MGAVGKRKTTSDPARLEARISPTQKRLFKRAAAVRGVSLTEFVLSSAHEAAMRTIEQHDTIILPLLEREKFIHTLLHPPAPSTALRRAAERYKRATGG